MESLTLNYSFFLIMFAGIAMLYASVGLGGGSAFTALLAMSGVAYTIIPGISLTLNLVVTFTGTINYIIKGHAQRSIIIPFIISSVPMSYFGGKLHLASEIFYLLLLISLGVVAIRIYLFPAASLHLHLTSQYQTVLSLGIGALLGFIAGAVGIGGGVYLVPLIIILGLGTEKEAAASGAIFIFVNSIAGIFGRLDTGNYPLKDILPLAGAVLIGGYIGSFMGASVLKPELMKKLLGGIIIIAIVILTQKLVTS